MIPRVLLLALLRAYVALVWRPACFLLDLVSPGRKREENEYACGNYSPVAEDLSPGKPCRVLSGRIPEACAGVFVRNGPNPASPEGSGRAASYERHWFDGDGRLVCVRLRPQADGPGSATLAARLADTDRIRLEGRGGRQLVARIGNMRGVAGLVRAGLSRLYEVLRGAAEGRPAGDPVRMGSANTAVVFHARRLLALVENDVPYHVRLLAEAQSDALDLRTEGRHTFGGRLSHPFTAHPKVDPRTGEMVFFCYNVASAPYLEYSVASRSGELLRTVPVSLPRPVMMHDMAFTERYSVFFDFPLVFDPRSILRGGLLFAWRGDEVPSRIGLLPRHATSDAEAQWFTVPACFGFHSANAWEEGDDEVVVVMAVTPRLDLERLGEDSADVPLEPPRLREWRLNTSTGECSERQLPFSAPVEFPVVSPEVAGRRSRFVYAATLTRTGAGGHRFLFDGVAKVDLGRGGVEAGVLRYGPGRHGIEAVFVPANAHLAHGLSWEERAAAAAEREDDGYLLVHVRDERLGRSSLCIYDASTMSPSPVCEIEMTPQRVPYGFHGTFVPEHDVQRQAAAEAEGKKRL